MRRSFSLWIVTLFVLLSPLRGFAQPVPTETGFQLQQFRPWVDPKGMFQTQSANTLGQLKFLAGFHINYAKDPLTLRNPDRSPFPDGKLITNQIAADLHLGIGIISRVDLAIHMPLTLYQTGIFPSRKDIFGASNAGRNLSGTMLSDLKIGAKIQALDHNSAPVALGFHLYVGIPTGNTENFNGEESISFGVALLISKQVKRLRFAFNLGYRFLPRTQFLTMIIAHEMFYKTGLSVRLIPESLDVVGELSGSTNLSEGLTIQSTPLEFLVGVKFYPAKSVNLAIQIGAGIPVMPGYGSPLVRAFIGVVWTTQKHDYDRDGVTAGKDLCPDQIGPKENNGCPWVDSDGDGLKDNVDKCPKKAGSKDNNGCPWGDFDKDGLKDNVDKCPKRAGPKDNNGCPYGDSDGDGIPDPQDRCPKKKGLARNKGCPDKDRDGDGVPDRKDKCPDIPGTPRLYGCPVKLFVEVTKKEIKILQKIFFKLNSSTIESRSFPVLDQIFSVVGGNPNIKLMIEGHTDHLGTAQHNRELSNKRAAAVKQYMIDKGIPHYRLRSKGFGRSVPIADNTTKEGRAKNRRVQFKIVE